MKKTLFIIIGFLFVLQIASGQSKVATLDASLGEGVHFNASAIVADTLNEQFVKSADFIAIDRAYVSSIQEEKKFQISGDVNADDIKELGATFGAKYICIANVSLLGNTYSVSARLIEVETAQVVSQESARMQGQIDVLFEIAETVGTKLIGKEIKSTAKPQSVVVEEKPPAEKSVSVKNKKKRPHFTVGYMFSGFMGDDGNDSYSGDSYYSIYETDDYAMDLGVDDAELTTWGFDTHMLIPINNMYWSLGFSYTKQTLVIEDSYYTDSYDIFSILNVTTGVGGIYPAGKNFQLYGGVNLGYMALTLGSDYDDDATASFWEDDGESAGGLSLGLEIGGDYFLGSFCLSARYKLSYSFDLTGDYIFTDDYESNEGGDTSFGVHGLVIGVGFTW